MKRMMTNALAVAAAASWVMVASAQSSTSSAQSGEQRGWSETKSMKFTGCLQQGDNPNSFKLTNVQPAEESRSGSTSGTSGSGTTGSGTTGSGTTGSGSSGSAGSMSSGSSMMNELELVASGASVDLSEPIGKRVEITGKAAKKDSTSGSTSGTSGTTGAGSEGGMHSGHDMAKKKVQVTAVRSLGGSCSGN